MIVPPNAGFFLSHRVALAAGAQRAGFQVVVACPVGPGVDRLPALGIEHHEIPLSRGARNLLADIASLFALTRLFNQRHPDVVHLVTAKPALLGGWAAALTRRPALISITGLGFVFSQRSMVARLLRRALLLGYRTALDRAGNHVVFQNTDDRCEFESSGLMRRAHSSIVPGSGTDLTAIRPRALPKGPPVVAFPARLLRDKGVLEFVEAARRLREHPSQPIFRLIGDPDPGNPTSIPESIIRGWVREGIVEWIGYQDDINDFLSRVHVVVLPSYREGFPKTLIDAAAAGRAAVTTDVPGCRDALVVNVTGLLVPVGDAAALTVAIASLLDDPARMARMGAAARRHAVDHFGVERVVAHHVEVYLSLANLLPAHHGSHHETAP
jgi:glycosyltransferase involved in cell wall biosynthesis